MVGLTVDLVGRQVLVAQLVFEMGDSLLIVHYLVSELLEAEHGHLQFITIGVLVGVILG